MIYLQAIDSAFLQYTISKTLKRSASVHLLFGFEYVIQASIVVSVFIKYTLSVADNYMDGRWENKASSPLSNCLCQAAHYSLKLRVAWRGYGTLTGVHTLQGLYVFYLELVTDMLHLFVYLIFFIIVFTNYGLPLHLVSC